jgi:hypothetical protein
MANIKVNAVLQTNIGFELKVFEFDIEKNNRGWWDKSDLENIKDTVNGESNCLFYCSSDIGSSSIGGSSSSTIELDGYNVEITIVKDEVKIKVDHGAFLIYSLTSTYSELEDYLTLKECVSVLNKMEKLGMISYIKAYFELRKKELTELQSLSEVPPTVNKKMAQLIQHISSIEQWLFLND